MSISLLGLLILVVAAYGFAILFMWIRQEHVLFIPRHDEPSPAFEPTAGIGSSTEFPIRGGFSIKAKKTRFFITAEMRKIWRVTVNFSGIHSMPMC
jgi:hypothetical protein